MIIREEQSEDIEQIWQLNADVFETSAEANLVNALRNSGCIYISLVAVIDNKIVGHIFLTPVELTGCANKLKIIGLAPMAVMTDYQNRGIGTALVKEALKYCRLQGYDAVVVLGHPGYYPRFGFEPSVNYGIKSEYDVPDDVFMILELVPGILKNHKGTIKYHQVFNSM